MLCVQHYLTTYTLLVLDLPPHWLAYGTFKKLFSLSYAFGQGRGVLTRRLAFLTGQIRCA